MSKKENLDKKIEDLKNAEEIYHAGLAGEQFDYKKGLDALIKIDKIGFCIYHAGMDWKQFDYKKGSDALIQKNKEGDWIFLAGKNWKQFNYKKGFQALQGKRYYKDALKDWPKGIALSQEKIKEIAKTAKKLPMKKLKLESALLEARKIEDMRTAEIYEAGAHWKRFDYNKGLDAIIQKNDDGYHIYKAGKFWKQFDYKKGLDALIKKDITGENIYLAGKFWKQFDYKKGSDALIKKDITGKNIYLAGKNWNQFDYKKGLKALKNIPGFYKLALKNWPKGIKQSLEQSKELAKTSKKLPMKKLKLESTLLEARGLEDLTAIEIHYAGSEWKDFDFDKGLDTLIQKDKEGKWIYRAGSDWKQFDYEKGLDALIQKDKDGQCIYRAGLDWKQFDYEKGLKALKNTSYYKDALKDWPKGIKQSQEHIKKIAKTAKKLPIKKLKLEAVMTPIKDFERWARFNNCKNIIEAGKEKRPGFDYKKALKVLYLKLDGYGVEYKRKIISDAVYSWPKEMRNSFKTILKNDPKMNWIYRTGFEDIKWSQEKIKRLGKTARKLSMKKLKLTEQVKYTEIQYLNKSFYNDLKRVYRAFKKVESPEKKKRLGFYLQTGRKIQGNKENIDRIIRDVFGKEEELSPNEAISRIAKFETPAGKKLYIRPETAYQTTQRLVSSAKLNKTISVSIFGEIYDDILSKYKKRPEGDDVIRAVNRYISGHFVDAAAFIRWTNIAPDWAHIDAFQTDFFSNLKAIANKDPNFKGIADDIRGKENEFWKTAMSYIVRTNSGAKVWTANTEELVKAIERVRGEVKLKEYYYKLPKLLGFRLINLEKLKQILKTRPGSKTDKKIKTFMTAVGQIAKTRTITRRDYNDTINNIAGAIDKQNKINKKAKKEMPKSEIDNIIQIYTAHDPGLASALHQYLDKLYEITNERKKEQAPVTSPVTFLFHKFDEVKKTLEGKKDLGERTNIWWANRQMLFESTSDKKSSHILEGLFDDLTKRI